MVSIIKLTLLFLCFVPGDDPIQINNEAVKLVNQGKYDQAIEKLGAALDLDPSSDLIRGNLATAHAQRGIRACNQGNYLIAREDLEKACRLVPDNVQFSFSLATCLYRSGDLYAAEKRAVQALKSPAVKDHEARLERLQGNILYLADRLDEALLIFEKRVRKEPKDEVSLHMVSKIKREKAVQEKYHQDSTTYFKMFYDRDALDAGSVGSFIYMLENERTRVCTDLNYFPNRQITVILYNAEDFKAVTDMEGWVGGLFDRKIRIPLADLKANPDRISQVLRHEYTHFIIYELNPACPVWINEGLANCEQYSRGAGERLLRLQMKSGRKPVPFHTLPNSFIEIKDGKKVRLYYAQSHAMMEYLIEHHGLPRIRVLLRELNKNRDWRDAFKASFNVDFALLEKDWLATLN